MSNNKSLLAKADLALADLTANGGLLQPEQAATFIRNLILAPTMLSQIRRVTMNSPTRRINKIGFGSRIMRKAVQGTALTQNQRSKPTTSQVTIETDEVIAEVRLPYDVLEDNIERATAANNEASNDGPGGLRDTLIALIAEQAASDLEELVLLADVDYTSGDADDQDYLSLMDGYLAYGEDDGTVVDFGSEAIGKKLFKKGAQALPTKYLRNRAAMRHFISVNQELEYRDSLANRGTALGDASVNSATTATPYGMPIVAVNHMPDSEGLFTDPRNLIFGIHRDVSMEFDKNITTREYIIVLTARVGAQVEEAEALVKYSNIGDIE